MESVSLNKIRAKKFCWRDRTEDLALLSSIRKCGLLQPLTAVKSGAEYELIDGHKRFAALKKIGKKQAPVYLIPLKRDGELFFSALLLNGEKSHSDWDRCTAIAKAYEFGMEKEQIVQAVLPLIGLTASSKILAQYEQTARLPEGIKEKIRRDELPFQSSYALIRFNPEDLRCLVQSVLPRIRPTASQLMHLCEWLFDLRQIQKKSLSEILKPLMSHIKKGKDSRQMTEVFYWAVKELRFPELASRRKSFELAAKDLQGTAFGLEIKAPENFEREGFVLQAQVRNKESLRRLVRHLEQVQERAAALFDTVL